MNLTSDSQLKSNFRILALDGGGIRGVITATILQKVEEILKKHQYLDEDKALGEYFDLVAGTSTGSLLAAGISLGRSPKDMINLYRNRGTEIFNPKMQNLRLMTYFRGAKYKNDGLKIVLREELRFPEGGEEPKLIDVENKENAPTLVILSYDTSKGITQYFASNGVLREGGQPSWYTQIPIWELCVCSAAAPTFFPPYQLQDSSGRFHTYIDGGVAANNPALAALTHAMYTKTRNNDHSDDQGLNMSEISILSIGTGEMEYPFDFPEVNRWGLIQWAEKIPEIFLAAPGSFETAVARQLVSSNEQNGEHYLRLDIPIDSKKYGAIDDPNLVQPLIEITEKYNKNSKYDHYDFSTGVPSKQSIEDLVIKFAESNNRSSNKDFINRFPITG